MLHSACQMCRLWTVLIGSHSSVQPIKDAWWLVLINEPLKRHRQLSARLCSTQASPLFLQNSAESDEVTPTAPTANTTLLHPQLTPLFTRTPKLRVCPGVGVGGGATVKQKCLLGKCLQFFQAVILTPSDTELWNMFSETSINVFVCFKGDKWFELLCLWLRLCVTASLWCSWCFWSLFTSLLPLVLLVMPRCHQQRSLKSWD